MLNKKVKKRFRLLPIFILIAMLTLSIRVNNIFDVLKEEHLDTPFVFHSRADANVVTDEETEKLQEILETTDSAENKEKSNNSSTSAHFAQSEIMILQELSTRRELLEVRSREIDKKAVQLKVAEEQIDAKLKQLKEYEKSLKGLMVKYNEGEKEKVDSLVKLYTTMKPKDAARIFDNLDIEVVVALLREMKPSTSSAILSQMDVKKTKAITDKLIGNNI